MLALKKIGLTVLSMMLAVSMAPAFGIVQVQAAFAADDDAEQAQQASEETGDGETPDDPGVDDGGEDPETPQEPEQSTPKPTTKVVVKNKYKATTIKGVKQSYNVKYTSKISDTVKITPALGRKVLLQHYNASAKAWETEKTYTTKNKKTAKVKLVYSKTWKTEWKGKWRVLAKKTTLKKTKKDSKGNKTITKTPLPKAKVNVTVVNDFIYGDNAVVYDVSAGKVVYDYHANVKHAPASMTKVMTAILMCEKLSLDSKIKITSAAVNTPYGIGVSLGDSFKMKDLMYALLLPSANDAATAAGVAISGSTKKFGKLMTKRAKQLGCTNTQFKNAHGLDTSGHYTTARDMAILASYAMTSDKTAHIRKVAKTRSKYITSSRGNTYYLYTTDQLLGSYNVVGLKTGTTSNAGLCFCGAFTVGKKLYISVVMGAGNRWSETKKLIKFAKYAKKHKLQKVACGS